ncbi:MAG: hypothetical protein M3P50_09385, partial [Actinomycetota bacterium]|nr:hypothetical protein [Actinomycetota bacterium]
ERTRGALGRLQTPLAAALTPGDEEAGQVPLFEQRVIAGVSVFALDVAPGLEVLYAVEGRRVVVATSAEAVARAVGRGKTAPGLLAAAEARKRIEIPRNGAEAVLFSDPGQLLALGDQIGITADPALQAVREDLRLLRTVSAIAQRSGTDTTAELFLELP